jgi:hypothetical protein
VARLLLDLRMTLSLVTLPLASGVRVDNVISNSRDVKRKRAGTRAALGAQSRA